MRGGSVRGARGEMDDGELCLMEGETRGDVGSVLSFVWVAVHVKGDRNDEVCVSIGNKG
jgi:hypothetical protein